jgi:putative hydrolase of the HAD superfamily
MLKSLYPEISWNEIHIIGLDMDGTLYDEIDFISEVYRPIASKLACFAERDAEEIYSSMLLRWIEKGSSYNKIFEEVLLDININYENKKKLISECIEIFRGHKPEIILSKSVETILNEMSKDFNLFLVSDGFPLLQARKFKSLGLGRWISANNVGITGSFGAMFSKPATNIIEKIDILRGGDHEGSVVYFGDRDVDAAFSQNAGFNFVRVKNMKPYPK